MISDGMATEDSFVLSCKSELVKDYVAQTTVSVKLISGVKSVDEFILLNPEPSPFTKFTDDVLDTSRLLQYSPIFFEPVKVSHYPLKLRHKIQLDQRLGDSTIRRLCFGD